MSEPTVTLGDLRRATAELPDSAPVHLSDPETLRALGEPIVWEGSVYLPILEPTAPTPSRVGVLMRWADEELGFQSAPPDEAPDATGVQP